MWLMPGDARRSKQVLREIFPGKLISLRDVGWPARSFDIARCYSFLWCYLKSTVYIHRSQNIKALKDDIRWEIAVIPLQ